MRRTREQAEETRQQVLAAALAVFSRKGYSATTLDGIAAEAGLTRGAVYWHFKGKADLYLSLLEERSRAAQALWQGGMEGGAAPLETLRQLLVRSVELLEEDSDYRSVLEMSWTKSEAVAELEEPFRHKVRGIIAHVGAMESLIERAIKTHEVRPDVKPRVAARAAYALMGGLITMYLLSPELLSPKREAPAIIDMFIQSIAVKRPTKGQKSAKAVEKRRRTAAENRPRVR